MNLQNLVKRARLLNIATRARDLEQLRDMMNGDYTPILNKFAPPFQPGTSRAAAWHRALNTTSNIVPVLMNKALAGLDFGGITWSEPDTQTDAVTDAMRSVDLPHLARNLAIEYKLGGAAAVIAQTPLDEAGNAQPPTMTILRGVNLPYTEAADPSKIKGWYRAIEYIDDTSEGKLRWWVEVYDFQDAGPEDPITHRVWYSLPDPTHLGFQPDDEFQSIARPRFALYGTGTDGLPTSPLIANMGRVFGLYATELRLATSEELAAYPMLLTRGESDVESVGPAESIAVESDGDARWMEPGNLEELRQQVKLKRDQVREAFSLPGGSLGNDTPSGEALQEANRGFMQESRALASSVSRVLTDVVSDYLRLLGLPGVTVDVPIERAYMTNLQLEIVTKGIEYGVLPEKVAARRFQQFL
ncbi:MAG: hypothetical protein RI554_11300, partial [Trueperaceae bacterium]|nr:hypothetical protein [Trueperaceae bacterium]